MAIADRRTPTASFGRSSRRVKDQARRPQGGVLAVALWPAGGGGVLRRPQVASPASFPRRQKPAGQALSRSALKARDALVLEHLPLADARASATARRLFPLVEREDLIQVAREALVPPRCRAGEPLAPFQNTGPC